MLARERRVEDEVVDGDLGVRDVRLAEGELVLGERARLVRAQDRHARELLHRRQPRDHRALARERARAHRHRGRADDLHRDGDGGDEEDEAELDGGADRAADVGAARRLQLGVEDQHEEDDRHQHERHAEEGARHEEQHALEVARALDRVDEGGGLAEERVLAGGGDDGVDLATLDHRPLIHQVALELGHRQRLAGERRLVDLHRLAGAKEGVGGDDIAEAEEDGVVGDELARVDHAPLAVAHHARLRRERRLQRVDCVARLVLLNEGDEAVDDEERGEEYEVLPVAEDARCECGDLDQPRHRTPELLRELHVPRRLLRLDLIVAKAGYALGNLSRGEAALGGHPRSRAGGGGARLFRRASEERRRPVGRPVAGLGRAHQQARERGTS